MLMGFRELFVLKCCVFGLGEKLGVEVIFGVDGMLFLDLVEKESKVEDDKKGKRKYKKNCWWYYVFDKKL